MTSTGVPGEGQGEGRPRLPDWMSALRLPLGRVGLAVAAQLGLTLALAAAKVPGAWRWSAAWWVAWLVPVNVATLIMMARRQRAEGRRFGQLFGEALGTPSRPSRRDLPWYLLALIVSLPVGIMPNLLLGRLLWGSAFAGTTPSFGAMPVALVWTLAALVPLTQGLTEPALYFGYVLPRLRRLGQSPRRAIVITAAAMSAQNVFFPWLFDVRFTAWRALMFLPLCLWLGWLVVRRPSLLPYLAVAHGVMNLSLVFLVLRVSLPLG